MELRLTAQAVALEQDLVLHGGVVAQDLAPASSGDRDLPPCATLVASVTLPTNACRNVDPVLFQRS
jgi:hypothetical protein